MSQDLTSTNQTGLSGLRRVVGFLSLVLFAILIAGLREAGSVEVYSFSVSSYVLGFVFYFIGAMAMWGFVKR